VYINYILLAGVSNKNALIPSTSNELKNEKEEESGLKHRER